MLISGQKLWITLLCISLFLPQHCKAALEGKEIWMVDDKDDQLALKTRRLLGKNDWETSNTFVIFAVVCGVVLIIYAIKKCCGHNAREFAEANSARTLHPPSRSHSTPSHLSESATMRPLAPPMTNSRSLILIPEGGSVATIFIGIENPTYIPAPYDFREQETNSNSTELHDLPPDYKSVAKSHSQGISKSATDIPNTMPQDSAPPKYEEVINVKKE